VLISSSFFYLSSVASVSVALWLGSRMWRGGRGERLEALGPRRRQVTPAACCCAGSAWRHNAHAGVRHQQVRRVGGADGEVD
jgi:hypothetical protein